MLIVETRIDNDPQSPREWDNLGIMVCKHRRYNLGDRQIPEYFLNEEEQEVYIESLDDVVEWIKHEYGKIAVILPLFLYDHSGITMYTQETKGYLQHESWDSSAVGFIFVTEKKMKEEKLTKKKAKEILLSEVKTYDQYLTGDVYGYEVIDEFGETLDSCWGFFGEEEARKAGEEALQWEEKKRLQAKAQKTKAYIKNRVPLWKRN